MGRGASDTAKKPRAASKPRAQSFRSASSVAGWVIDDALLFNDPDSPFRASIDKQDPKMVVVTGENASGKSLFVRVAAAALQQRKKLPVSISIRERAGAGTDAMGGMRRVMMFGDEGEQSTGATSVKVISTAFRNLDRPNGSMLIVDEPELGLAEAYARALGEHIGKEARHLPKGCLGVMVVSHSRPLIQGLLEGSGRDPSHVAVAAEAAPKAGLRTWLDASEHRSVEELLDLEQVGLARWRQVNKLLRD